MISIKFDQDWATTATAVAKEAGMFLKKGLEKVRKVNFQDAHDVKLQADVDSEKLIREKLAKKTDFPVIGEEIGGDEALLNQEMLFWVVDPLDGSYNYLRGQTQCCVSIGLMYGTNFVYGAIYDFNRDELFSGGPEQGVFINGEVIKPQWAERIQDACLSTGFPIGRDYSGKALGKFLGQVQKFKKIRMIGSAALALANVACGRMDGYIEESIRLWDIAAGAALVLGVGGHIHASASSRDLPMAYNFWAVSNKDWMV